MRIQIDEYLSVEASGAGLDFAQAWIAAGARGAANDKMCVAMLRRGYQVKAVTPDDGWVERAHHRLTFPSYALYRDHRLAAGDLIALGSPSCDKVVIGTFRIVRVLSVTHRRGLLGDYDMDVIHYADEVPPFDMIAPG